MEKQKIDKIKLILEKENIKLEAEGLPQSSLIVILTFIILLVIVIGVIWLLSK